MEIMWSPWRSKYIETFKADNNEGSKNEECIFCNAINAHNSDAEYFVVARKEHCIIMLNKYPYNNGHLMIAPYRHIGEFDALTEIEMLEIMKLINETIKILKKVCGPHAFNIGVNLGREAGAGVPGHIHFHVVPRWNGDTSFMPVLADVKIVSQSMDENYKAISEAFRIEADSSSLR